MKREVVYLVKINGYVKIGHTVDMRRRLYQLKRYWGNAKMLARTEGDRLHEEAVQEVFERYRVHQRNGRGPDFFNIPPATLKALVQMFRDGTVFADC